MILAHNLAALLDFIPASCALNQMLVHLLFMEEHVLSLLKADGLSIIGSHAIGSMNSVIACLIHLRERSNSRLNIVHGLANLQGARKSAYCFESADDRSGSDVRCTARDNESMKRLYHLYVSTSDGEQSSGDSVIKNPEYAYP